MQVILPRPIGSKPIALDAELMSHKVERVAGIEPAYPTWKDGVLPLNYTRIKLVACGEVESPSIVFQTIT